MREPWIFDGAKVPLTSSLHDPMGFSWAQGTSERKVRNQIGASLRRDMYNGPEQGRA